jgi:hypothetical protein
MSDLKKTKGDAHGDMREERGGSSMAVKNVSSLPWTGTGTSILHSERLITAAGCMQFSSLPMHFTSFFCLMRRVARI